MGGHGGSGVKKREEGGLFKCDDMGVIADGDNIASGHWQARAVGGERLWGGGWTDLGIHRGRP